MQVKLRYFSRAEFLTSGGVLQVLPPSLEDNLQALAIALDALRHWWGRPIVITSGYRTPERNQQVGGVPNSTHTRALAVDCHSLPFPQFADFCRRYWPGGVGTYAAHVHLDLESYRRWLV